MFEYGLLKDAGKVSAEIAKLHAETEFEKYRIIQDKLFMSDYDKFLLELEEKAKRSAKNNENTIQTLEVPTRCYEGCL